MNESNREKIKYSDIGKLWGKTLKQQIYSKSSFLEFCAL